MDAIRLRAAIVSVTAVMAAACGSSNSPTAPTPVATTPPVVTTPPPAPTASYTNYAGRWAGSYVVEQCTGTSGSMSDVLCSEPHGSNTTGGLFQPGATLPITLEMAQNNNALAGTLSLGQITGNVIGLVTEAQTLSVTGGTTFTDSANGFVVTNTITQWDSAIAGDETLNGTFTFNVRVNIFPGNGVVRVRLVNVRR